MQGGDLQVINRMSYNEKILDHYENPRNVGSLDKNDPSVGTALAGAPSRGDVMKLQIEVNDRGVIEGDYCSAYFGDSARNAAKLAGIQILRLIHEPTAAALSYSKNNNSGIYAVYDLGGGTFAISILKLHQGVSQALAVGGDTKLGGDDLDCLLSTIVLDKYRKKDPCSPEHLLAKSRSIKEHLALLSLTLIGELFKCEITTIRAISSLVNKTINIVTHTTSSIDLKINDIKGVVLVGGAARVPLIQISLVKLFRAKVLNDVDPDKAVVIGAALQAHYFTSNSKDRNVLPDALPLSLGIETMGGIVEKIIPRNTPVPASETREFTTYIDGQTAMKIHVCRGEREIIEGNKPLAQFELKKVCRSCLKVLQELK